MTEKQILYQALEFAKRGWPVIPLHEGRNGRCSCSSRGCSSAAKHPRTVNGIKDASIDPMTISQWWQQWPAANIGVASGAKSGIAVVDIDPRHDGDQSWRNIAAKLSIKPTLTVQTGGGGQHLYYKYPAQGIRNKANLLPGVDIRGESGYVVAPPSIHASGNQYRWANEREMLEFPTEIIDLVGSKSPSPKGISSRIRNGSRNSALFSLGGLLRRQGLGPIGIQQALNAINESVCEEPLPAAEIHSLAR